MGADVSERERSEAERDRELLKVTAERLHRVLDEEPPRWLLVDVERQRLLLVEAGSVRRRWPVSTAAAGVDAREGSGGTPPGVHAICRKIGAGAPAGTVFRSRLPTGEVWRAPAAGPPAAPPPGEPQDAPAGEPEDLVLTRLLTLEGRELGVNLGTGVDSRRRYIYLHGTSDEARIGRPVSHGCIRLRNADVVDLFERVEEGDPVVIV